MYDEFRSKHVKKKSTKMPVIDANRLMQNSLMVNDLEIYM